MDEKIIDIDVTEKKEGFFKKSWRKTKETAKNARDFIFGHPFETAILGAVGVKILTSVVNNYCKVSSTNAKNRQMTWGESKVYDRSHDVYYSLKRPMSNNESKIYSIRKDAGDETYDILDDMNLI